MEGIHTDVEILLECVKCQLSDPISLKSSLGTLASVLTSNDAAKESFRNLGGLKYVFNLMLHTDNLSVKQSGLFCLACAVEKSVFAQKSLSQQYSFGFVHKILIDATSSSKMKQTAVFFLLCLVANNGLGQNLARQTRCLADLIEMCRTLIRENQTSLIAVNVWTIVNSAISVCVNNPQNEENQHHFSTLFPHFFKLIHDHLNPELLKPALSLMGLAVANNVLNQDRVRRCGGLETLVTSLGKCMGYSILDEPSLAIPIINTIDSCISDNETNCLRFGELGGINLLLETLRQPELDEQETLQVILTLGHSLDTPANNQSYVDKRGYQTVVKLLTEAQDEELMKALKYTLNLCQKEGQINRHFVADSDAENSDRQQDGLILEKISELTAKLNSFEEETRQEAKLLTNLVENQNKKPEDEKHPSRLPLTDEIKISEKNLECPESSRTETLLQQLIGLFGSSSTPEKPYRTTSNIYANCQDQFTPVKNIQTDCWDTNTSTYKQAVSHSTINIDDYDVKMASGNKTQNIPQDVSFDSAQRKCVDLKQLEQIDQNYLQAQSSVSNLKYPLTTHGHIDSNNNHFMESVNPSKNDNRECIPDNLSKNGDTMILHPMERNLHKNDHTWHNNFPAIHGNACFNSNNSNRSDVNVSGCLHACTFNQNRDPLHLTNKHSSNSMVVNGDGTSNFTNTQDARLSHSHTVCQSSSNNQSTCNSVDTFGHKSCNRDGKENQFRKSMEDGNFNEPHRIMCENVNENNSDMRGSNRSITQSLFKPCASNNSDVGVDCSHHCDGSNMSSVHMNQHKSQDSIVEIEKCIDHTHTLVHCGHSKSESQSKNLEIKNECSSCHDGISNKQTAMVGAGQNMLQNECFHRELNYRTEKEPYKNIQSTSVIIIEDDDQGHKPSEPYRRLAQRDTVQVSDYGSNTSIQISASNSPLKERRLENHTSALQDRLTDPSITVTKISSAENEDSSCDIFLPKNDCSSSGHSSNKMLTNLQAKQYKCFKPKIRFVKENERTKRFKTTYNHGNIHSRNIPTNKNGAQSEQESTPKPQQRIHCTEKKCMSNSETRKTCSKTDKTDTFVKPIAVPFRRKIVTPSSSGSSINSTGMRNNVLVFSKTSTVGIQVKPVTKDSPIKQKEHTVQPPPSPAMSEFDFGLLTTAKRNVWQLERTGSCTPVVQRLSVKKLHSFTDTRCTRKPTHNPTYSRPVSEMCPDYSDNESISSFESESTEGSQKSNVESEINSSSSTSSRVQTMKKNSLCPVESEINSSSSTSSRVQTMKKNSLCPGCNSSELIGESILNSRTFNIALETSINACSDHRNIRRLERNFIQKTKESMTPSKKQRPLNGRIKEWLLKQKFYNNKRKKLENVYDFHESSSDSDKQFVSPPHTTQSSVYPLQRFRTEGSKANERRPRIPYSEEELQYLKHGVEQLGKKWNQILVTYKFHQSRTAVDLMEKHKRIVANKKKTDRVKHSQPLSMCEERRLMRGVKSFGYNWKSILHTFKFSKERSAEDLRNKWRTLNKD